MTTRRTALTKITSGAVALGAVLAGGGLMRSCTPDASTEAVARGHQVDIPGISEGGHVFAAWGIPLYVRRIAPDLSQHLAEMPPSPDPWLRRDSIAEQQVEATVETVLQGVNQDILVLIMNANLRLIQPDAGDWKDQGGFLNQIYPYHYDGLGRIRRGSEHTQNLFSPTLHVMDGRAFILRHSIPNLNTL